MHHWPKQLNRACHDGLNYLSRVQGLDGGFMGEASPHQENFSRLSEEHDTIFFTALILTCLSEFKKDADSLKQPGAAFLLRHKDAQWAWNYWMQGSPAASTRPYPPDLDDTACALAAITQVLPGVIDGAVLAAIAKHLIATETQTGGPYTTWLVDKTAPAVWHDVDVAVNANVSFFLSLHGVELPNLRDYLGMAIKKGELLSPYYVGEVPVLYFLARAYRGPHLDQLRTRITNALRQPAPSALTRALLITAAVRVGLKDHKPLESAVQQLLADERNGSWPAAALYYEPPVNGVVYYAGSRALTTAFALEALTRYRGAVETHATLLPAPAATAGHTPAVTEALTYGRTINYPDLRSRYCHQIELLATRDRDGQITDIATITARAAGLKLRPNTLSRLNLASLNGWLAYTIYDDFLDMEGDPSLLGAANLALRQTTTHFKAAGIQDGTFQELVEATLTKVDGANTWEIAHTRVAVKPGQVRITGLPNYTNLELLAERSAGHLLAAVGAFMAGGYTLHSPEVTHLQAFFQHLIVARQLSDDAHDWEDDLAHGRITAVVGLVLKAYAATNPKAFTKPIFLSRQRNRLRQHFWEHTITEVSGLITSQIKAAREALKACDALKQPNLLEAWLEPIAASLQQIEREQAQALQFIAAYEQNDRSPQPPPL